MSIIGVVVEIVVKIYQYTKYLANNKNKGTNDTHTQSVIFGLIHYYTRIHSKTTKLFFK